MVQSLQSSSWQRVEHLGGSHMGSQTYILIKIFFFKLVDTTYTRLQQNNDMDNLKLPDHKKAPHRSIDI